MKKLFALLMAVLMLVSFGACTADQSSSGLKTVYAAEKSNDVIAGNIKFAFDFFKQLNMADREQNIFISPFSISAALSMLYNGAEGELQKRTWQRPSGIWA
jgi:serine protease inhibitor